jgi:uncharacterized membrane protein (UPF0127 family)
MSEQRQMKQNLNSKLENLKKMRNILFSCLAFFLVLSSLECGKKKFIKIFLPDGNPDQGMLFLFKDEDFHFIWMKNMKISIDILWLDREKRIIHIERKVPPCKKPPCASYSSKIPALYVLEIKAGMADKNKLKLYDRLEFILE